MSLGILLKLFGDICLYFGILSGLPSLFSFAYSFLLNFVVQNLQVWHLLEQKVEIC